MLGLQIRKDDLAKAPTWPFDIGVVGRFAAVILSVMAILISAALRNILGI